MDCSDVGDQTPEGTVCEHDGVLNDLLDNCNMVMEDNILHKFVDYETDWTYYGVIKNHDSPADVYEWRCTESNQPGSNSNDQSNEP
eukprot:UN07849